MITEDYVSYETAKLLKEKGFDVNTFNKYADKGGATEEWYDDDQERRVRFNWDNGTLINPPTEPQSQYKVYGHTIPAPTLQMAMKWLREVHKLEVRSIYDYDKDSWWGNIDPMFDETDENSDIYQKALRFDYQGKSYEEAAESAIKYCLENLI